MSARRPGEKRRRAVKRERERLAYEAKIAPLRAAGKCCGNCAEFKRYPHPSDRHEHICEMDSGFDGYTIVKADGICEYHKPRPTP